MKHLFKALIFSVVLIPLLSACGNKGDVRYIAVKMSEKSQSWSIVDTQDGNVLADDEYSHKPSAIIDGMYFVENDKGLYDFYSVDDVNHTVAEGFKDVTYFNNGVAVVSKDDDGLSLIDNTGQIVAKLSGSIKRASGFENDFAIVENEDGKMGYINTKGEIAIKMSYDIAEPFSEDGFAVVGKKDVDAGIIKYEIINTKGEKLFGFSSEKYSEPISQFVNGSIAVKGEKEIIYLDESGGKMLKAGDIEKGEYGFYNGMTIYADGNNYGIKDEAGAKVINAKYEYLEPVKNGNFIAKKDDKYMLIDSEGQKLTSDKYDDMEMINETRFIVKNTSGGNYSLIDVEGNEIGDSFVDAVYGHDASEMITVSGGSVSEGGEVRVDDIEPTGNVDRDIDAYTNGLVYLFENINDADQAQSALDEFQKLNTSFSGYYERENKTQEFQMALEEWVKQYPDKYQIINNGIEKAQSLVMQAQMEAADSASVAYDEAEAVSASAYDY